MSRHPPKFSQADVTRAVRGALAAGVQMTRVEIDKDGRIILMVAKPTEHSDNVGVALNEWDAVK